MAASRALRRLLRVLNHRRRPVPSGSRVSNRRGSPSRERLAGLRKPGSRRAQAGLFQRWHGRTGGPPRRARGNRGGQTAPAPARSPNRTGRLEGRGAASDLPRQTRRVPPGRDPDPRKSGQGRGHRRPAPQQSLDDWYLNRLQGAKETRPAPGTAPMEPPADPAQAVAAPTPET